MVANVDVDEMVTRGWTSSQRAGIPPLRLRRSWLSPDEVRELVDEAYATRLLAALQPGPAAIRAHDGLSLLRL